MMDDNNDRPATLDAAASALESSRRDVVKAFVIGNRGQGGDLFSSAPTAERNSRTVAQATSSVDESERSFGTAGAIEPPYNPGTLTTLLEHSNALRQCVDAYVTNIDAFGHRFEPIIDLEAADAKKRVRAYLLARRLRRNRGTGRIEDPTQQVEIPTDTDVDAAMEELRERMAEERLRLQHFFDFACLDISFVTLRRRTRMDLEVLGNGYWEVVRDQGGDVAGFEYVPGFTVRLMPADAQPTRIGLRTKINDLDYETVEVQKYFRRYVQVFESRIVYFKELGDPRILSRKNGTYFATVQELLESDPSDGPATEMLHFRVHSPKSVYGVPRWIGNLLSVMGSRASEEVNYTYFENKSVPPLALLVSGGRVSEETVTRIKDFIENEVKGKRNFHKLLVLEAESGGVAGGFENSGKMRIELKPLTAAQHNDALFQNYDERNIDKVGQSFRLPRMLRGDVRDFNRSTAEASLDFAESQVFGPERDEFDFIINRKVFPIIGARFHKFKTLGNTTRNPKDLSDMIATLTKEGVLTPSEARDLTGGVFNRELRQITDGWVRQPLSMTLAGITPRGLDGLPELPMMAASPTEGATAEMPMEEKPEPLPEDGTRPKLQTDDLLDFAKQLLVLRKALLDAERIEADTAFAAGQKAENEEG
jgi:PBSX family phage portal protein